MELDGIDIFVKVVQAGSFSRAAKQLGMPNSTVSAKVSALEKRLGVSLLQRTTRKLHITQAGEAYFRRCAQALAELQAAEKELETERGEPSGLLRLTAPVEIGHNLLPALVHAFIDKYPKMTVEVMVTNHVLDLVAEGIDLAIRAGDLKDSRLIAKRFVLGQFSLWASPSYLANRPAPRHPKDLAAHQCLEFLPFKNRRIELSNGKEKVAVAPHGRVAADDFETLRSLAVLGNGIAFLPGFLCADEAKQNKLVPVLRQWHGGGSPVSLVYSAQRFVSPKIRAFIDVAEATWKNSNF